MTKKTSQLRKPKVIFFDIETSLIIATTFTLYPEHIPHTGIIQDWFVVSIAWKEQGNPKVHSVSINDFKRKRPDEDFGVLKTFREAIEGADILIAHNGDKFDIKKLNARLIYNRLAPIPKLLTIDTLKEVKKIAAFTSNRLDYLGSHLIGHGKLPTTPDLWMRVLKGDRAAVREMVKYNKVDVIRLEQLYNVLRPYMKNPPNFSVLMGHEQADCGCKSCGSLHVKKNGYKFTAGGVKRQEIKCLDCHHYSSYPVYKI